VRTGFAQSVGNCGRRAAAHGVASVKSANLGFLQIASLRGASAVTNMAGFSQSGIELDNLTGSRAQAEVI
jgi:hypothetical protein